MVPIAEAPSTCVVGINEDAWLLGEWHEREIHAPDGLPFRAAGLRAGLQLPDLTAPTTLMLIYKSPVSLIGRPFEAVLSLGGETLGQIRATSDAWQLARIECPEEHAGPAELWVESATSVVPAHRAPASRDTRRLAWYLGALRLESQSAAHPA